MPVERWSKVRTQILERLDIIGEYKKWGFKPVSDSPNDSGWINGFAIGREEKNPSAGVYVGQGPQRGKYKDFAAGKGVEPSQSFFFAAASYGGLGNDQAAVQFYANQLLIEIPKEREEALSPLPWSQMTANQFARRYPKVTNESLQRFGVVKSRWNSHKINGSPQIVLSFPIMNVTGVVGSVIMPTSGPHVFVSQKAAPPEARGKHTLKGSKKGWLNRDAFERLHSPQSIVEIVWKVEGITDALTLDSIIPEELRDKHVVVTNAGGAHEYPDRVCCSLLQGKRVFVIHDADEPGEAGAKKWVDVLKSIGARGSHVRLPFVVTGTKGKDVRDWIEDGRDYNDMLNLASEGEEFSADANVAAGDVPQIIINGRQLSDVVRDAASALKSSNSPPTLFLRDGTVTQIRFSAGTRLKPMTDTEVGEQLSRSAKWVKATQQGEEDVFLPKDLAKYVACSPTLDLPPIIGLSPSPMFSVEGSLVTGRGYCPETRYYNTFDEERFNVPASPTGKEVSEAREFVAQELFHDFPFYDQASVAAAFEFAIRPFVRLMIDGPTPLLVIHAPTERTGKGLLAEVLSIPFLGTSPMVSTYPDDDDELRKRITALLATGRQIFMVDNLPPHKIIDSPALAALLTSSTWEDRLLGSSKVVSFPATASWVATGNNPKMANELAGRSVSCRLVSDAEDPSQRTGFKHADLSSWAREHRWEIAEALMTIVSGWLAAGRPRGTEVMGRFESWAATMGGILGFAGIDGLLDNRDDFNLRSNEQRGSIVAFVAAWQKELGAKPVLVSELVSMANRSELLIEVLGDGSIRSQQTRLGRFMNQLLDRVFLGQRIYIFNQSQSNSRMYRIMPVSGSEGDISSGDVAIDGVFPGDMESWES